MELIDLRNASLKYKKPVEIEMALAWNALKKYLENKDKSELFEYIHDIKITEKNISIYATKPIVKSELTILKEDLTKVILASLQENYDSHTRNVKIL